MDSTTVSLFSDVMRGAGSYRIDGRKKGGVKAHVLLDAKNDVPSLIHISESARNDRVFMEKLSLKKDDILVFDKGYQHFAQWQIWTDKGISWVTRLNDNQYYDILDQKKITVNQQQEGVCEDQKIFLGRGTLSTTQQITVRLVSYYVPGHKKIYHYLTNNFRFKATTVAGIYKDRWQIESFFKRIKQNNPLRYFLGDSENAICIQLWCAFIKDLLIKIVKDQLKRKWAFSNISAMIRHHLMNYLNLFAFLNDPEKMRNNLVPKHAETIQIPLFSP
jgi:IS4 transposase